MKLFLVRHGQSVGNLLIDQDLPDSPLTPTGVLQADKVASFLSRKSVTRIISSPLIRALQTARPLSRALSLPIEVWIDLYEYREAAPFLSPPGEVLQQLVPEAILPSEMQEQGWCCPGGETTVEVERRAKSIVRRIYQCSDESIAVFAHGMLNEFIIREILQLSNQADIKFAQENTGVSSFERDGNLIKVLNLNHIEHLNVNLQS